MRFVFSLFTGAGSLIRVLLGSLVVGGLGVLSLTSCQFLRKAPSSPPPDSVTVLWAGGVTATSARVTARLPAAPARVRLAVTAGNDWQAPALHPGTQPTANPEVHHFALTDLSPDTTYRYALQINGRLDTTRSGRFRTFNDGPHAFRVAMAGCAQTGRTALAPPTTAYTVPRRNPFGIFGRRPGQFVIMDVQDNGDELCVSWTGKRYSPFTDRLTTLLDWSTCFSPS